MQPACLEAGENFNFPRNSQLSVSLLILVNVNTGPRSPLKGGGPVVFNWHYVLGMDLKPHLTWDSQLALLKDRGLIIDDDALALTTLQRQNYYRLRGYFHVFLANTGAEEDSVGFRRDVNLNEVLDLVEFDRKLRAILFEALSQFEINLRTSIAYHGGAVDPEIHLNGNGLDPEFLSLNYLGNQDHNSWIESYKRKVQRHQAEEFVEWHFSRYGGVMPIWVAVEILDFGSISKLLRSTSQALAHQIAAQYDCTPSHFKSWVASLNDLRNAVAHQTRLWNRTFAVNPKTKVKQLPLELEHLADFDDYDKHKIYSRLALLLWLDRGGRLAIDFQSRLLGLLDEFPKSEHVSLAQMGFPTDWRDNALWRPQEK